MFILNSEHLNDEQITAIKSEDNVLLIACPGSGKTRTLTYKLAYELSNLKSSNKFVVAITYTHRAADEIKERVELLGVDTSQLWIGTIHSFCLEWILKPYRIYHDYLKNGFRVINSQDQEKLLTELCISQKFEKVTHWDCGYYFDSTSCILSSPKVAKHATIHKILNKYFDTLKQNQQVDFEHMLLFAFQLVKDQPLISKLLANLFSYVLIDEYQDTKEIQYSIICSILKAGKGGTRAFIVGDPNQSIFGSLGGFPMKLEELKATTGLYFEDLALSKNYRSTERIVSYFNNFNVFDTTIVAASKNRNHLGIISYNDSVSVDGLEDEIVRLIQMNLSLGVPPNEICVLAPQWVHLASMTRKLVSRMPDQNFDGPGMVPFARDIDNFWFKLSRIALTEASPNIFTRRLRWAGELLTDLEAAGAPMDNLNTRVLLRECNSIKLRETNGLEYLKQFFELLFERLNLAYASIPVLAEHHNSFFESATDRIERLRKDGADFISDIRSFRKVFGPKSGISISTIHGIKGDEYDTVIAYGLLEGMVPNFNDKNPDESAKKLLYVIASRARKNLHLISEQDRVRYGDTVYSATTKLADCSFAYDIV